jgi:hypothetical protein
MIERQISALLDDYLATFPVTYIGGTRQSGKSTLTLSLLGFNYITLDDISMYNTAKTSPKEFVYSLKKPVIIDEIQRAPELLIAIKQEVDENRANGNYILTGSANLLGMKQVSDSLAGRLGVLQLYPFSARELSSNKGSLIDELWSFDVTGERNMLEYTKTLGLIINGGYPEIQKIKESRRKKLWFDSYISTYIERDAFSVAQVRKKDAFYRLYQILSSRSAQLLSKASLAADIKVSPTILDDYLGILQTTYQIELLSSYFNNTAKRFVKMPKLFFMDSGVLCSLLGVDETNFTSSPFKGQIAETFVFSELKKALQLSGVRTELFHWRTSDAKEIDFLLKRNDKFVCIEVKSSTSVDKDDFRHIDLFARDNGDGFVAGFVFYLGDHILPFGDNKWALPFGILG